MRNHGRSRRNPSEPGGMDAPGPECLRAMKRILGDQMFGDPKGNGTAASFREGAINGGPQLRWGARSVARSACST